MRIAKKGFSLVELLVVIGIMAILVGLVVPTLTDARRQARQVVSGNNQRDIIAAVTSFALDHNDRYPESIATIGSGRYWNWQEPMMLTGFRRRSPRHHRSLSANLYDYIEDVEILVCPNAPSPYPYLQEMWDAGDTWNHPVTVSKADPVYGTYCFYWNYVGYRGGRRVIFKGPQRLSGGRRCSTLLTSDYFGFDHWQTPESYASCEEAAKAAASPGTMVSSSFWSWTGNDGGEGEGDDPLGIMLRGGYVDGRVERYAPTQTVPMKVSISADGTVPYPDGVGPGDIYIPHNGL